MPDQIPTPDQMRRVLGTFATGVTLVTCLDTDGRRCAMTVNSFTSVSLDPPLVLFCLGKAAFHRDRFLAASAFAITILGRDQEALSNRFAAERLDDFADLRCTSLKTGCPIPSGAMAALDCRTENVIDAGDHHVMIGGVVATLETDHGPEDLDPLVYFRGRYAGVRR